MIDKVKSMKSTWLDNQQITLVFIRLNDDIMNISTLPPRHISLYDSAPPSRNP